MKLLIAAFSGAFIASILSIFYNYFVQQGQRRSDLAMEIVSWVDDVYDRLITIHAQREATFTGKPFGLTNDEYRAMVKEVKAMLLASKMHARVSLVYGESQQLRKFDNLREEFINITEILMQADKDSWGEADKAINSKLTSIIEPLRESTERNFLSGSKVKAISQDLVKNNIPIFYLPTQDRELTIRNSQKEPVGGVGKLIVWQTVKLWEAFLWVIRVLAIVLVIGFLAWHYSGKPDLYKRYQDAMIALSNPPANPIYGEITAELPKGTSLDVENNYFLIKSHNDKVSK